jgi:hypothetical protein
MPSRSLRVGGGTAFGVWRLPHVWYEVRRLPRDVAVWGGCAIHGVAIEEPEMAGAMADGPRKLVGHSWGKVADRTQIWSPLATERTRCSTSAAWPGRSSVTRGSLGSPHQRALSQACGSRAHDTRRARGVCSRVHGLHPSAAGKAGRMVQGACVGESGSCATAQTSIPAATSTQCFSLTTRWAHGPGVLLVSQAAVTVESGSPPTPCVTSTRAAAARRLGGFL